MLRELIKGATTAAGVSAIVISGASLIAPTSDQSERPGIGAPGARPAPPEMAAAEESVPARPESLPERAIPEMVSPDPETEKAVDLAIPAGSQFNRPREDFQPVAPDAGEAARGFASAPTSRPAVEGPAAAPAPDTSSGDVPAPGTVVAEVVIPEAGVAPALPALVDDGVPRTVRDVTPIGEAPVDPAVEETLEDGAARAAPETRTTVETGPAVREAGDTEGPAAAADAPIVVQVLPRASGSGGLTADEAPVLPAATGENAPRSLREGAPVGTPPEMAAVIDTTAAEPRPEPGAPEVSAFVAPTEAPVATENTGLAGADAPSGRPFAGTSPRLSAAFGAPRQSAPAESSIGAPAVLERISAPAATGSGLRPETPLTFLDPPVQLGAEGTTPDVTAPVRIVPRRIILDSARDPAAVPDIEPAAPRASVSRALTANAAGFENPDEKPLFSIVLIDDPSGGVSRSALLDLDMLLTFAIDPARPDAASVAQAYRDAGHEVLMLADGLPVEGAPQDIEIAMAGAQAALPQAVGVLDRRSDGFARNRTALSALLRPMAEAGLGFVGYGGGLGDGLASAEQEGVPAEAVFRIVDDRNERATVLTRYLDRATFEAEQEGQVIVVGRTRPAMVTALLSWTLGRRADTVTLAPVSALLLAGESGS